MNACLSELAAILEQELTVRVGWGIEGKSRFLE